MKLSKLPYGALFTFKRRDKFRDQFDGIICRNVGMGLFKPELSQGTMVQKFHSKDRVKLVERTDA